MSSSNRNPAPGAIVPGAGGTNSSAKTPGQQGAQHQQSSSITAGAAAAVAAAASATRSCTVPRQALHLSAATATQQHATAAAPPPLSVPPSATGGTSSSSATTTSSLLPSVTGIAGLASASPMALPPFTASRDAHLMTTNNLTHTPPIFLNRKLRAGKWIVEEEKYAEVLIELFEKGLVARCENGSTLRAFLSQKLHCAPMRISKKFAGKGIGKMVYLSKLKSGTVSEGERGELLNRVKAAEEKFYRSVFPNNDSLLAPLGSLLPQSLGPVAPFPMLQGLVPLFPQAAQALPIAALPAAAARSFTACLPPNALIQAQQQQQSTTSSVQNKQHQQHPTTTAVTTTTQTTTNTATQQLPKPPPTHAVVGAPATSTTTQVKAIASASGHAGAVSSDTEKLRQSFLSALHQKGGAAAVQVAAAAPAGTGSTTTSTVPTIANHVTPGVPSASIDYRKLSASGPWAVLGATTGTTATVGKQQLVHPGSSMPNLGTWKPQPGAAAPARATQTTADQQVKALVTELPDFLSGFDKANKNAKAATIPPKEQVSQNAGAVTQQASLQYSPPFTSRSFDDFHRFLGKDVIPLGGGEEAQAAAAATETKNDAKPDTMALFTAESYAMFAQESALAASQHDAYLAPSAMSHVSNPSSDHHQSKNTSFDIDGMVKLVSEHVSHHHQEQQQQQTQQEVVVKAATATQLPQPPAPVLPRTNPAPTTTTMAPTYMNFVSGSEQSDPSSSGVTETEMSSVRGSTSESAGGTTGGSDNTSNESEGSGSDSDDGTKRTNKAEASLHHHPSTSLANDWNKRAYNDSLTATNLQHGAIASDAGHLRKKSRPGS